MALASCTSENGAGDAVIGFGEAEYTFSEDQSGTNGYVRLPLTITGEPKSITGYFMGDIYYNIVMTRK